MNIYICMYACMYCMRLYVCACIYVYMHIVYVYMYARVHTCMYICIYVIFKLGLSGRGELSKLGGELSEGEMSVPRFS